MPLSEQAYEALTATLPGQPDDPFADGVDIAPFATTLVLPHELPSSQKPESPFGDMAAAKPSKGLLRKYDYAPLNIEGEGPNRLIAIDEANNKFNFMHDAPGSELRLWQDRMNELSTGRPKTEYVLAVEDATEAFDREPTPENQTSLEAALEQFDNRRKAIEKEKGGIEDGKVLEYLLKEKAGNESWIKKALLTRTAKNAYTGLKQGTIGFAENLANFPSQLITGEKAIDLQGGAGRELEEIAANYEAHLNKQAAVGEFAAESITGAGEAVGRMAPSLAIGGLTGNPNIAIQLMSSDAGLEAFSQARESGKDRTTSLAYGGAVYLSEFASEKLGQKFAAEFKMPNVEDVFARRGFGPRTRGWIGTLAGGASVEAGEEWVAGGLQAGAEVLTGMDPDALRKYYDEGGQYKAAAIGFMAGNMLIGPSLVASKLKNMSEERIRERIKTVQWDTGDPSRKYWQFVADPNPETGAAINLSASASTQETADEILSEFMRHVNETPLSEADPISVTDTESLIEQVPAEPAAQEPVAEEPTADPESATVPVTEPVTEEVTDPAPARAKTLTEKNVTEKNVGKRTQEIRDAVAEGRPVTLTHEGHTYEVTGVHENGLIEHSSTTAPDGGILYMEDFVEDLSQGASIKIGPEVAQTEATVEPYSPTKAETKRAKKIQKAIDSRLPDAHATVTPVAGGFQVSFPNTDKVATIREADSVPLDERDIKHNLESYGLEDTAENREWLSEAEGAFRLQAEDGTAWDTNNLIYLRTGLSYFTGELADTIAHEIKHFAVKNGIVTQEEVNKWWEHKGGDPNASFAEKEEEFVTSFDMTPGLVNRIIDAIDALVEAMGVTPSEARRLEQQIRTGRRLGEQQAEKPKKAFQKAEPPAGEPDGIRQTQTDEGPAPGEETAGQAQEESVPEAEAVTAPRRAFQRTGQEDETQVDAELARIESEAAAIAEQQAAIKKEAMRYQGAEKNRLEDELGYPRGSFDLPYSEWAAIRDAAPDQRARVARGIVSEQPTTETKPPKKKPPKKAFGKSKKPPQSATAAASWLRDAIQRKPAKTNTTEEIADWIRKGFNEENYSSLLEGGMTLEQAIDNAREEIKQRGAEAKKKFAKRPTPQQPPFTRTTPREGEEGDRREHLQERNAWAREQERELTKEKDELKGKLSRTRRNAHRKRGAIQGDINALDKRIGEMQHAQRRASAELDEALMEDVLENPRTEDHAIKAREELHRAKAALRQDERGNDTESSQRHLREASRYRKQLQASAEKLAADAGGLNPSEIEGAAAQAAAYFSPTGQDSLLDEVRRKADQLREARPRQIDQSASSALSEQQVADFNAEMEAAASQEDWHEQQRAIRQRAEKANESAKKKAVKKKEQKAKKEAAEKEQRDIETAGERRAKAKTRGKLDRVYQDTRKRSRKIKGKKETRTIDGNEVTVEAVRPNFGIAKEDDGSATLYHFPSGKTVSGTRANLTHLIQTAEEAGLDLSETGKEGMLPSKTASALSAIYKSITAGGFFDLPTEIEETLSSKAEVASTDVEADMVLDAYDVGVYDVRMQQGGLETIRQMAREIPEFSYEPVFVVDADKNLVYRDGKKFTLKPEPFNLHPGELTEGQTVGINLEDLGIRRNAAADVIAKSLKDWGFSKVSKPTARRASIRATLGGESVEITGQEEQWSVSGTGNAAKQARDLLTQIGFAKPKKEAFKKAAAKPAKKPTKKKKFAKKEAQDAARQEKTEDQGPGVASQEQEAAAAEKEDVPAAAEILTAEAPPPTDVASAVAADEDFSVGSPAFAEFFGNSKVVDDAGNPRMAYRGVRKGSPPGLGYKGATYWASSKKLAEQYAWHPDTPGNVVVAYLRIENPAPNSVQVEVAKKFKEDQVVPELKRRGYDGYIVDENEMAVFDDSQILLVPPAKETQETAAEDAEGIAPEAPAAAATEMTGPSGSGQASKPTSRPSVTPRPGSSSGAMLHPVQMPELFALAKELMEGKAPRVKKTRSSAGLFKSRENVGPLDMLVDPSVAMDEQAIAQTLAHEIGHLIDFLPEKTLQRGNLLGRLQSLRKFLKGTMPPLNKKDQARLRRQARKAAGGKGATKADVDAAYLRMVKGLGMLANAEIRQELIDLTKWWSGDYAGGKDSYVKYRESSRELYAEALSVFLNSPGDLETRAPEFYRALLDNFNSKPDALTAYSTLQQMLNGTGQELADSRTRTLRDMFDKAEEHINHLRIAAEERNKSVFSGIVDFIGQYFITSAQPVLSRLGRNKFKSREAPDAEAARFALDELFTIDSPNHTFLRQLDETVYQPLIEVMQKRGMDRKSAEAEANFTIGEYLFHWRVANERDAVANPAGFSATPSASQLDAIKTRIGDASFDKLRQFAQNFHDLVYAVAEEAAKEGVYNQQTFDEVITPNKDNYSAFRVTHYIDGPDIIATGVIKQVGTFSDVQNPFHATVLKVVRLNRLIELNRAKNRVRVFLENSFPGDVAPVETVFAGENRARIPKRRPGKGKEHLVELIDGKPAYFEVPAEIAKAFSMHDIGGLGKIASFVNSATYKVFHPFFVTYNPGFVLANPFRDLRRTWVNLGSTDQIPLHKLLYEWARALPVAVRRQKGIEEQVIRDMLDNHALDIPYTSIAAEEIESQVDQMFQRYGLREKPDRILEKIPIIGRVLNFIEHAGAVTETATKVAGWRVLEEKGVPVQRRSYRVRKYVGTPDYKQRGLATALTNSMMMYSRVRWNGLQADVGLASHPETAAGWWWRQLINIVLPTTLSRLAAYGAFGMAIRAMFGVDDDDEESMAGKAATQVDEASKRIAKYFLTDYDVLPLGVNEEDKAVFITIPRDDLGKFIARTWWHAMDLIQLAAGGELREDEGVRDIVGSLFTDTKEELIPAFSPPIEITSKWLQYGAGINPIDSFYNQEIVPHSEWEAGGWHSDSKMIAWTLDKFGAPGAVIHYALSPFLGESFETGVSGGTEAVMKTAGAMTGLRRFLRVSNSGLTRDQWARLENADQEAAAFRLSLPESARDATTRRYFLSRQESLGSELSRKEKDEKHGLDMFYSVAYIPLRKMIQEAESAGKSSQPFRDAMKQAADDPMGLWSSPPDAIADKAASYKQSVVYDATALPPDPKDYKDQQKYRDDKVKFDHALDITQNRLRLFDVSHSDAQKLLLDYYKGTRKGNQYWPKLEALAKLYGEDPEAAKDELFGEKDDPDGRKMDTKFAKWVKKQEDRWKTEREKASQE